MTDKMDESVRSTALPEPFYNKTILLPDSVGRLNLGSTVKSKLHLLQRHNKCFRTKLLLFAEAGLISF